MSRSGAADHLARAQQFLTAAELELELDDALADAATSNAVLAGIRASDAICVARLGRSSRARNHQEALAVVRQAGPEGRSAATLLSRLLAVKNKAQYDTTTMTPDAASRSVDAARKIVALAKEVLAG